MTSTPPKCGREITALRHALGVEISQALADTQVVEVLCNPDGRIWIDRLGQGLVELGRLPAPDAETVVRLVADHIGEVVNRQRPTVAGVLPVSGERFQGMLPPVVEGPAFAIRKKAKLIFTLDDYVASATMTEAQAELLRQAVAKRQNVIIAGGTGSGKTTLANALLALPAFAQGRVVIIEDTPELQCAATNQVRMLTRRAEPPITMAELVRDSLRLRPDRIVIGEVRDGSALDLLKAWNTGHPGGVATIHANSAEEALYRLEDLVGEVAQRVPHRAIAQGVNCVAFIARTPKGRRLEAVVRVRGHEAGRYAIEEIGSLHKDH